jgi:hypothetical protein
MAWDESKAWLAGTANERLYQDLLDDAATRPSRVALRKKILHPAEMPREMSRQGLLKHLLNEQMNTRMETVDAYMQVIPPGQPFRQASTSRRRMSVRGRGLRLRPAPGLRCRDH